MTTLNEALRKQGKLQMTRDVLPVLRGLKMYTNCFCAPSSVDGKHWLSCVRAMKLLKELEDELKDEVRV